MAVLPKYDPTAWTKTNVMPEKVTAPADNTRVANVPKPTATPSSPSPGKNTAAKTQAAKEATSVQTLPLSKGEAINLPGIRNLVDETEDQKKVHLREKLEKFFLNRYIIEPLDHVWIWLTSPSKSLFVLEDQSRNIQRVVEAPDSAIALELQIDQLTEQMVIKTDQKDQLKKELDAVDKTNVTRKEQLNRQIKSLEIETSAILKRIESLGKAVATYNFARSTDAIFSNRTIDLTDTEINSNGASLGGNTNQTLQNLSSEVQGLSEQQFQVFEGVILDITESYSDGKYTLSAKCKDMFYYLEAARIMSKPGLQGTSTIDPTYEVNTPIIEKGPKTGLWKTGSLVRIADDPVKDVDENPGLLIAAKEFAKTDAANVISFLILGIPYNVGLFVQNAMSDGRIVVNDAAKPQVSDSATVSGQKEKDNMLGGHFEAIRAQLGLQNAQLGDFKPFTMFGDMLSTLKETKDKIGADIKVLEGLAARILKAAVTKTPVTLDAKKDEQVIKDLKRFDLKNESIDGNGLSSKVFDLFLVNTRSTFPTDDEWKNLGLQSPVLNDQGKAVITTLYGRRESLASLIAAGEIYTSIAEEIKKSNIDNMAAFLSGNTKKREDIINNRDVNYLMVSSEYTMNNDLEAFNYMMGDGNWNLWQSEFEMPLQTCKKAAEVINWEFFVDESGNIRFESSKYNRILKEHLPRLFARMLIKDPDGSIADPVGQALWNKFQNNTVIQRLAGNGNDSLLVKYKTEQAKLGKLKNDLGAVIFYEREAESGVKSLENLEQASAALAEQVVALDSWLPKLKEATQQVLSNIISANVRLIFLRSKKTENDFYKIFAGIKARDLLFDQLENWYPLLMAPPNTPVFERSKGYLDALKESFLQAQETENTYKFNFVYVWTESQIIEGIDGLTQVEIDFLNIVKGYLDLMTEVRTTCKEELDYALKRYKDEVARTEENQKKAQDNKKVEEDYFTALQTVADLENDIDQAKLDLSTSAELESLTDDARIHRIPDAIIISSSFTETKPTFTRLDVSGEPDLVNLDAVQSTYYLAAGVDFDLWRTYGYISNAIPVPYFHDAASCKPYCQVLLGRQWGLIFSAELTVRGDSKYRLNDTVYLESRDMYFRIAGISHSFVYGSSFQTSLTLDYGRRPEFIIPDPWDILGKITLDASNNALENNTAQAAVPSNAVEWKANDKNIKAEAQKANNETSVTPAAAPANQVQQGPPAPPAPVPSPEATKNQKEADEKVAAQKAEEQKKVDLERVVVLEKDLEDLDIQIDALAVKDMESAAELNRLNQQVPKDTEKINKLYEERAALLSKKKDLQQQQIAKRKEIRPIRSRLGQDQVD